MTRALDMARIVSGNFAIPSGSLGNAVPADGSISTAKLADDAVTSAKIADDAVVSAAIADDAVVTAAIADDAITSALIADDAVVAAAIADDAVVSAALATDAVGADALSASAIAATDLPTGTVLQSVTQSSSTVITVTSASMTGFGLSQSFTPKSASSTILILVAVSGEHYNHSDLGIRIEIRKDSSQVRNFAYLDYHSSDTSQNISVQHLQYAEAASNTNARTYDVRAQPSSGSGTARVNNYNAPSYMTIMEIAG